MKDLKKEELLRILEIKFQGIWTDKFKQAYQQIKEMIQKPGVTEEWIEEKARELLRVVSLPKFKYLLRDAKDFIRSFVKQMPIIAKGWLPTAENINALPEPVRNYIADMQTNADPPSMVADNIIMKDTIKTLEKLTELPEITEAWTDAKAKQIKALIKDAQDEDLDDAVTNLHYLGLSLDIVTSIIDDLRPKK